MSDSSYETLESGQIFSAKISTKRSLFASIACCDCNLVHDIYVWREGNTLFYETIRNQRSTGQLRRWHGSQNIL